MILVIAGPSGSGKTTFIDYLIGVVQNIKIINVDVVNKNRSYFGVTGRNSIDFDTFKLRQCRNVYSATHYFESSIYGYALPDVQDNGIYVLDYPGDYPTCKELRDHGWFGVLILPPTLSILKKRLTQSNRSNRIPGACIEYQECLDEIACGLFDNWIIIKNDTINDFEMGINDILQKINFGG